MLDSVGKGSGGGHESDIVKHLLNQESCREGLLSEMRGRRWKMRTGPLAGPREKEQEFIHRGRTEKQPQSQERTQVECS